MTLDDINLKNSPISVYYSEKLGKIELIYRLTGLPGFSQSHWHIISRLTMTASSMPTGLIWKVCFHSRGS